MIEVIMATYNAQEYLLQQLNSIFRQTYPSFHLTIRDNCSSDDTVRIIKEFAAKHPGRITLIEGMENLGAKGNFSFLADASHGEYVMFSDADDVWLPQKIEKTLAEMKRLETLWGKKIPLLVHTDLKVVDRNLNIIDDSFWDYSRRAPQCVTELNRILVQNSVTGCTIMANRALLARANPIPQHAAMHDWWLALVACVFGHIGTLYEPTMLYRQHGRNEVGAGKRNGLENLLSEVYRGASALLPGAFGRGRGEAHPLSTWFDVRHMQAKAFLERYGTYLSSDQNAVLEAYVSLRESSWWTRKQIFFRHKFYCTKFVQNVGVLLLG